MGAAGKLPFSRNCSRARPKSMPAASSRAPRCLGEDGDGFEMQIFQSRETVPLNGQHGRQPLADVAETHENGAQGTQWLFIHGSIVPFPLWGVNQLAYIVTRDEEDKISKSQNPRK